MLLIQRMDEFEKKYPEYADLMPIRESIYKLNRLEGLQQSIRLQQRELGAITNRELKEHLASLAYKSTGAADKIMGLAVNSSAMKLFSGTVWSGEADFRSAYGRIRISLRIISIMILQTALPGATAMSDLWGRYAAASSMWQRTMPTG